MRHSPARLALTLAAGALTTGALVAPAPSSALAAPPGAAAADDGVLDILVLGDSYAAGNGATDDQGAVQTYGPAGCRRSRVNWGEKYAAMLRAGGQPVRLVNHACSGGVTADVTSPRQMDTASKVEPTPAGVTTTAQADASLTQRDPCNTHAFPDEEFWTYHATAVNPVTVSYDCTRFLQPQVDFVDTRRRPRALHDGRQRRGVQRDRAELLRAAGAHLERLQGQDRRRPGAAAGSSSSGC